MRQGLPYEIDSTLVRGLDYYTRTVFEFTSDALGAQSGVGGGGRYDGLIEQLGGPPTPGMGWAAGIERILLAGDPQPAPRAGGAAVRRLADDAPQTRTAAFELLNEARTAGLTAVMDLGGRSVKGQLGHAGDLGARWVAVVEGPREPAQGHAGGHPRADRNRGRRARRAARQPRALRAAATPWRARLAGSSGGALALQGRVQGDPPDAQLLRPECRRGS